MKTKNGDGVRLGKSIIIYLSLTRNVHREARRRLVRGIIWPAFLMSSAWHSARACARRSGSPQNSFFPAAPLPRLPFERQTPTSRTCVPGADQSRSTRDRERRARPFAPDKRKRVSFKMVKRQTDKKHSLRAQVRMTVFLKRFRLCSYNVWSRVDDYTTDIGWTPWNM